MTLFGYGKTTQAIAAHYSDARFYDDKVHKPFTDEHGHKVYPASMFDPDYSMLEIPSPGIPPYNAMIQKARHLVSEYDFFPMPYSVWISGTNGKTTTTQMTHHLLRDHGALAGGNIGTPLADLDPQAPIWVLETSSFTLHYTQKASPGIYILLPITPDHISWHGSMQAYEEAKLKPLFTMREGDVAIIPARYANTPTKAHIVPYDNAQDLANYFGFDMNNVNFKGGFLVDALLAMAVDKILFDRIQYEVINAFVLDAHRQEKIVDTQGRTWVNDSKATNIDATLALLQAYSSDEPIHLILGGDDKGVDLSLLFEHLKAYNHIVLYLIGSNEERLAAFSERYRIPYHRMGTMARAIATIDTLHNASSVALLSPAAASLDQFKSYADRGNQFREAVTKLS
ncbi:MAG: UDP-N-acetylmuramoyl-L-alanyl-D-glutamate synthetase [Sulfuricurvum sp. PC08-66]|nr:MAG: UDP-N-acetylmuramoyl-L-alanyl-D-glutamate synthetase [Sulfuricurvum sp. PC08-66]